MNNNLSDDDFWNMLEVAEESVNTQTEKSVSSLKERIDQFSINESKSIEELKMMQARKRKMAAQAITAERKARNHRLFKLGEIVERVLKRNITNEDIENLKLFSQSKSNMINGFQEKWTKTVIMINSFLNFIL